MDAAAETGNRSEAMTVTTPKQKAQKSIVRIAFRL